MTGHRTDTKPADHSPAPAAHTPPAPAAQPTDSQNPAQDVRNKSEQRAGTATLNPNERTRGSARDAQQEVHKGVVQAQQTARNNARDTHRNLTSSEKHRSDPNRTHRR